MAQRVGRGIALLFHDRGTWRGWVVSSTARPHFTPGEVPVPILQEAGWASGPVWTSGKSRPQRDLIPDRPARSQSLYLLSHRGHKIRNLRHLLGSRYRFLLCKYKSIGGSFFRDKRQDHSVPDCTLMTEPTYREIEFMRDFTPGKALQYYFPLHKYNSLYLWESKLNRNIT